jgi:hypothetical protein
VFRGLAPIGILECWNNGRMGFGIMVKWFNGKTHPSQKIKKWIKSSYKPIFQHSTIPSIGQS